jgi:hypothetical protein
MKFLYAPCYAAAQIYWPVQKPRVEFLDVPELEVAAQ